MDTVHGLLSDPLTVHWFGWKSEVLVADIFGGGESYAEGDLGSLVYRLTVSDGSKSLC